MIKSLSIPLKIALVSFVLGTLLFLSSFLYSNQFYFLIVGSFFVAIAVLINSITLLYLIRKVFISPKNNPKTTDEIFTILINIPIAALYLFIIINQNNF